MPTGRVIFAGGLTHPPIQVPSLPDKIPGVRSGTGVQGGGVSAKVAQPIDIPSYGALETQFYAAFVPEIAKANNIAPSNQGHRALLQSRFSAMAMPRNNPSRSQFSEGYTEAIQVFAASNTWQLAGPTDSPGTRAKQPNQKFVSPFSGLPIPTRMPWDL